MSDSPVKHLAAARAAIVAGDMGLALDQIERFSAAADRSPPDAASKQALQAAIAELRELAEASLRGTKAAMEQIHEIVQAARTLQTYDDTGRRRTASTVATLPRRF
ncbi:hypothetical protein [Paracoccus methylarcula]|uniref:Uncharacterized protein n=1 Tax=Paracoccus methylarcula TaxID=72022 RepID=A0A422QWT7_9RHOB|nr:hypothetical protein [Paracoccus methylarcula]RNF34446.1 hypothetical protein A7A09_011180 [Paracoccus methylarcula]